MKLKTLYILGFICAGLGSSLLLLYPFIAAQFNLTLTETSLLKTIYNITSSLFAFPSLYIINKFNNKKLLFLMDILAALAFAALGIAQSFFMIMFIRVAYSLTQATRSPINKAEITRQAKAGQQGKTIGNAGSVFEIGKTLIATLCGYAIIWWGWQSASIVVGLSGALIVMITGILTWKHPYKDLHVSGAHINVKEVLQNKKLLVSYLCSFLDTFASSSIPLFLPFLILYYKYDVSYLPLVNAAMLVGAIAGRSLLGGMADKHRPGLVFAMSEFIMGVMALILGLSSNVIVIFLAALGIGIVTRGTLPVTSVMVLRSVSQNINPKSAFTLELLLLNIAGLISATLFGWIGDQTNLPAMFISFFVAALIPAVVGLYYDRITHFAAKSIAEVELVPAVN